jgi:hypothetical protein
MSYGIMRFDKIKSSGDMAGIDIHNERKRDHSNSNPDIDFGRSHLNYHIPDDGHGQSGVNAKVDKFLKENYKGKSAIRKDAVKICEGIFTSDAEFFAKLTPEQTREFFEDCYNWTAGLFGKDRIMNAVVHLDEKTPHMHLDLVPLTQDGRLCAKELLGGRKRLQELQDNFHESVGKKWGLDRGSRADLEHGESGRKHKTMIELKDETQREVEKLKKEGADLSAQISEKRALIEKGDEIIKKQNKTLERQESDLKRDLLTNKQIDEIPFRHPVMKKDEVIISESDFNKLKQGASIAVNQLPELLRSRELEKKAKKKLEDVETRATQIISQAETKATQIISQAETKAKGMNEILATIQLERVKKDFPELFSGGNYQGKEWHQHRSDPTRKHQRSGDVIE